MKKVPSFLLRRLLNCGRVPIFAPQSRTKASQIGRLAQLVQSVCLTSRGSGVRIPQRPHFFQTAIHRKMGSVFFCARTKTEGGWETHAGLAFGCAQNRHRLVVPSCVLRGISVGCSFSCERVCAVAVGIWCHLLEKPIDEWRCSLKKWREKEKRRGKLSISPPRFLSDFSHNCVQLPLSDLIVGKGQRMSPGNDEKKRFPLCACWLFRNAALLLFRMRRERSVEVRGG